MNSDINSESIKKKRSFVFLIWILPFIALLLSSWMVYEHLNEQDEEIVVYFESADGFTVGKTPLKYKGIKIGIVSKININDNNLNEFIITININKKVKKIIAKEGSTFWKVEPKATLNEISGLNTILSGVYIEVSPQSDTLSEIYKNKNKQVFKAVENKPITLLKNKGIFLSLRAKSAGLSIGAPVLYKSFVVGKILEKSLKEDQVFYTIFIQNEYKHLVKKNSHFWKINGVDLKASLSKIELKIESLATLIAGGITFDSKKEDSPLIKNKTFKLYISKDEILFDDRNIILTQNATKGLDKSLKEVFYKGFVVGKVVRADFLASKKETDFFIKLKKDYLYLLEYKPYFYITKPELSFDNFEKITNILKSNHIELQVSSKKMMQVKYNFELHNKAKKISMYSIILRTNESIKVSKGSPVYFKDIEVGTVTYKKLYKKGSGIKIGLEIFWKYRYLINDSSLFYLESPIEINANLSGINIKSAPLKSYIKAAISFDTPHLKEKSTTNYFQLLNSRRTMLDEKYLQKKAERFIIEVEELTSLTKNDFIYYKGIEVGKVIRSKYNKKSKKIDIELFIFSEFSKLINATTRFYSIGGIDIDVSLDKINIKTKSLDTLIKGALSFITLNDKAEKVNKDYRFKYFKNLEEAEEKYTQVSVFMTRGYDLKKGSKLLYKDIVIGRIKTLAFSSNNRIKAEVDILKTHKKLLRKDTVFYLNNFNFSLSKIENPKAALFGPSISIIEGQSSLQTKQFTLLPYKPLQNYNNEALRIVVHADMKSSLKQNTPVYYRQLQIGAVEKYTLSKDSTHIKLQVLIDSKYKHLVRKNSIFYNAGAFGIDFYLFGAKIKTETLETLINGGLSMVTPTKYGKQSLSMQEYILEPDLDEAWLKWNPKIYK